MKNPVPLQPNLYYHIYNRGNNREDIFKEDRNYEYFQQLWKKYIVPMADTYAYCLLPNHFHALVRIKEIEESLPQAYPTTLTGSPSKQFSNLFNAYAKAINAAYDRTGSLFQRPFGRISITDTKHLLHLVAYIHQNPQKHGLTANFRSWAYSSFNELFNENKGFIQRDEVLDWFGGIENMKQYHLQIITPAKTIKLVDDDQ